MLRVKPAAPAVHRSIVCVDVERFTDRDRTRPHQLAVREGMYRALRTAFTGAGIPWQDCYREDRGDGALILVPPQVPKALLSSAVAASLAAALTAHNQAHDRPARIRLRLALHAGEICHDEHGVTGTALNLAFRLLEAEPLGRALADSAGVLAMAVSPWFYDEVVRHDPASAPAAYRPVHITVKRTRTAAWVRPS